MVDTPHWTSSAPINPGWHWYRDRMHSAMMLRVDECSLISSPGEFDDIRVADMAGDWWSAQIKAKDRKFYRGVRLGGLRRYGEWPRLLICTEI